MRMVVMMIIMMKSGPKHRSQRPTGAERSRQGGAPI